MLNTSVLRLLKPPVTPAQLTPRFKSHVNQYLGEFEHEFRKLKKQKALLLNGESMLINLWGNAVFSPDRVEAFRPAVRKAVNNLRHKRYTVSCSFRGGRYPYAYLVVWLTPPAEWYKRLPYYLAKLN